QTSLPISAYDSVVRAPVLQVALGATSSVYITVLLVPPFFLRLQACAQRQQVLRNALLPVGGPYPINLKRRAKERRDVTALVLRRAMRHVCSWQHQSTSEKMMGTEEIPYGVYFHCGKS
ncbi:hypothetical protein STEG23_018568, partial [Scotinomys teguina]